MRIAIVSDVHSNLAALEAVLAHAEQERALDQVWTLGDHVGYGPQPVECLDALGKFELRAVAGNHDLAAVGIIDTRDFNAAAAAANAWNAAQLTDDARAYLTGLPLTIVLDEMSLAHGSLRNPVWEYVITLDAALGQFEHMTTRYSFVGHTHVPLFIEEGDDGCAPAARMLEDGDLVELGGSRLILNPGGVGQPRDGDPRSAYAVYDTDEQTVEFHRVEYDIKRTQRAMKAAGLPSSLISRLAEGR
jgi:predicted phosphodiesterase